MAVAKRGLKEWQREQDSVPLYVEDDERMRRENWRQNGWSKEREH